MTWSMKMIYLLISLLTVPVLAEEDLNVLTYNIRQDTASDTGGKDWQARKGALADYLHDGNFDIIGLQEVRHNQLLDLDKALPKHTHTGVGRDDGKTRGEYSPILFNTNLWELDPDEHGTFWLSDTPARVRSMSWGNRYPRICTWARLVGRNGPAKGKAIYVFNTHWDHQSQPSRLKSATLILEKIASRTNRQDPLILLGDFNANTENPAIKALLANGVVIDHGGQQHRTGSRWKPQLEPGLRIDHVFTSPSFKAATTAVETNPGVEGLSASDHHPVVLKTTMPGKQKTADP